MAISNRDYRKILEIIDIIYSVPDKSAMLSAASQKLQKLLVGAIGLHRKKKQGDFTNRDKKIINILLPHIAREIRNHQLMNGLDLTKESYGVIAVGENGKPFYMNEPAKLAIKNKPITAIPERGLGLHPAFFKGGGGTYRVRTVPLGKKNIGKVILLERHPPEHKINPKLMEFHLSRREEEVVMLVIQGLSNLEIAQKLFIAEQTVKDHLHHVFGKMNIRRRSEIAAKVMGLAPQAAFSV